ncbi:MAG: hypothetical protein ABII25_01155, partial [bacterium]
KIGEDEKNGATGKILLDGIEAKVAKMCFEKNGDDYEQKCSHLIKEKYPNCEEFWKFIIVPSTNRINDRNESGDEAIREREGISEDIKDIAHLHYTTFLNLVYAHDHLTNFGLSSFEDFYIHLSSACDLAEGFLLKIYLLICECNGEKSSLLAKTSRDGFFKLCGDWYDENYNKLWCNYLKKGKGIPIKIPHGKNMLDEYFNGDEMWEKYKVYTQKIREYRNVIIHNCQIGRIRKNGKIFVPKRDKIQNYKTWDKVFAATKNKQEIENNFIEMKQQMKLSLEGLEDKLNDLWEKPISDMKGLLYKKKNEMLFGKYNFADN